MNRTLLLIIVDFLFLNLIALTRWEKAEPVRTVQPPVPEVAANAPSKTDDLVEAMRQSLADEQSSQQSLAQKLAFANTTLTAREQNLAALQAQKGQLAAALTETQRTAAELSAKVAASAEEATLTRDQLAQLQRELDEKNAEAERQRIAIEGLARQQADSQKQIAGLTMAVVVGETEKEQLRAQTVTLQSQVQTEREERAKVEQNSAQLAQGVGQLAQKSGELTKEIRDNRPINPNVIFSEFLANRVQTKITARRPGFLPVLLNPTVKDRDAQTVLVSDGRKVYALMHLSDTPFALSETPPDYDQVSGRLSRGSFSSPVAELQFLQLDPRVVVVPVDESLAALMGAKIYQLAKEPFKFPDAVLVRADDGRYGETPFRIDAVNSSYVKLDNRIVTRLFGEIAPKRGDLVFSKTGEIIGIMVNSDFCAVLGNFNPAYTLKTGDNPEPKTSVILAYIFTRLQRLPFKLQ